MSAAALTLPALALALEHLWTHEVGVWKQLEVLTFTEPVIRLDVGHYLANGARETALVTRYYYVGPDGRPTYTTVGHP